MAKLTMATSADFRPKRKIAAEEEKLEIENRRKTTAQASEWPRQKLRIADLSPDEQFIKEISDHEYKYFILLIISVIIMAAFVVIQKNGLYNEFLTYLETLF